MASLPELLKRDFRIGTGDGSSIHVHLVASPDCKHEATVIFSHGFNSSGTEGARRFMDVALALSSDGYRCVLLDSVVGGSAARDAAIPTLLVHGDADLTAPVELSRRARRLSPGTTVLVEITGASHSFSSPPEALDEAIAVTRNWLKEVTTPT